MSKTRSISASVFARSVKSGSCHGIACRVGACRPPSFIGRLPRLSGLRPGRVRWRGARVPTPLRACRNPVLGELVEHPLEAAGMRFFGLGEGFEPFGDLVKALFACGAGHAGI